jgi:LysM repeat protein
MMHAMPPATMPNVQQARPTTTGALGTIPGMIPQQPRPGLAYLALKTLLPKAPAHATTYTVQPGDCLWTIAQHFYGDGGDYLRIFDANPGIIHTPGLIKAGQVLLIPGATAPGHVPVPAPPPAAPASPALAALPPPGPAPQQGVPWSIFSQPNGQAQAVSFAGALLRAVGAPLTPGNVQVIYDWEVSEGSGGWCNPLNGGDFGNLATSGTQYGGGANDYPSLAVNVRGMAGILLYDQGFGYDAIVSALRADNPQAARVAICNSDWAASHYNGGASFSDAPLRGNL